MPLPCYLSMIPLKLEFLDIYLAMFSESVISEIEKLWGSYFFSKYSNFYLNFKNWVRNSEKVFCSCDNCIWISNVKFSILRTGYFSSAANVLTSSAKNLHVNKRDFSQLHWLGSDKWRWERFCITDSNRAWAHLPCCLLRDLLKMDFLDTYLTTFVISEI